MTKGEPIHVRIPTFEGLLGDKLTAFAPHTTGVPIGSGKHLEMMKQFFDISKLLDKVVDFEEVMETYSRIVEAEIGYRGLCCNERDVLMDTLSAALSIATRGKAEPEEYKCYHLGINALSTHVIGTRYSGELASTDAIGIAYLITCLLSGRKPVFIPASSEYANSSLHCKELLCLKALRRINPMLYAYLIEIDRFLLDSVPSPL